MKFALELLKKFFINYFWLGLVIILLSIIIDFHYLQAQATPNYIKVTIKALESIGIAVLISSIFSFASGTSGFVDKIQSLLEGIIIKRNFLGNIDPEGKKEALKSLIQPSDTEKNKYPNIGDYYGYFINKTLGIGKKSVRSNYQVSSRAYYDPEQKRIAIDGTYSYRVYPSSDGFHEVTVGFAERKDGPSTCKHISICTPDGKRELKDKLEFNEVDEGGDISKLTTVQTSEYNQYQHLDVELKIKEYGKDHWALITFKALQPTDGFKFILHCDNEIEIQEHAIFVVGASYYIDISEDKKDLTVTCNQWINEGSGLTVLVAIPHEN